VDLEAAPDADADELEAIRRALGGADGREEPRAWWSSGLPAEPGADVGDPPTGAGGTAG
jgi:hypothetical protein